MTRACRIAVAPLLHLSLVHVAFNMLAFVPIAAAMVRPWYGPVCQGSAVAADQHFLWNASRLTTTSVPGAVSRESAADAHSHGFEPTWHSYNGRRILLSVIMVCAPERHCITPGPCQTAWKRPPPLQGLSPDGASLAWHAGMLHGWAAVLWGCLA